MIDFSLSEKLVQLKDIIMASPLFFVFIIVGILLLIVMIIGIKKNRRINKIVFTIAWIFVGIFVIVRYHSSLIYIFDRLIGRIVEEIYFPSISLYTVILILTNIMFFYSIFSKKIKNGFRILNLILGMEMNFLFVLILDIVVRNSIDIYANLSIYSNPQLLVLLEISMMIFCAWILLTIIMFIIHKYAVKKVYVDIYKEEDYEVLDFDDLESHQNIFSNNITLQEEEFEIIDI